MAKNLRAKIPEKDTLLIHDRNAEATRMFAEEMRGKGVEVVESSRELAERSVSLFFSTIWTRAMADRKKISYVMSMFYR